METKEIIFNGYLYDVTDFIKRHPGGSIIEHYTKPGEDSSLAIQQFHYRSMNQVKKIMSSFTKRPVMDSDCMYLLYLEQFPTTVQSDFLLLSISHQKVHLDPEVIKKNRALTEDFTKLYLDLERDGFFEPSHTYNLVRLFELLAMWYTGYVLLQWPNNFAKLTGLLLVAFSQGRVAWVGHECGHYSYLGIPKIDRFIQIFLHGTIGGTSASWWRRGHNRHHAMPQRLNRDVDLNTVPLLAYNAKVVKNAQVGKGFFIKYQAYFFPVVSPLLGGLFWRWYSAPKFVFKSKLYAEIVALIAHYALYLHCIGFWAWFVSSWMGGSYIFLNFALSHTYLPVTTEPTHWVEYALLHTADVEQTRWCDYWMGFLNYQIEHHLFPAMPEFRQPLMVNRVKALAEKHNLPYHVCSYAEALRRTRRTYQNLNRVSDELLHTD